LRSTLTLQGPYQASTSLSTNYWGVDFVFDDRRAILDQSHFPREPAFLPRVLAALTGVSTDDEIDVQLVGDTMPDVFDYFSDLPYVTIVAPPGSFIGAGVENGKPVVEAAFDIELPGSVVIPRRTRGIVLSTEDADDELTVVSWRLRQPAWNLLVEILRGAANLTPAKSTLTGTLRLKLVDLGVQGDLSQILSAGLKFLRCVLRSPDVANRFISEVAFPGDVFPGQALLDLSLGVASGRVDIAAAQHAIEILQSLLLTGSMEIWQGFRASGFFDSHSRRQGSVASLIQSDAMRGQHGLTVSLLRLVRSIASANSGDPLVVRSAMKLIHSEIWSQFSGWRYRDVSERYEIAALLTNIFDTVLRHPLSEDGKSPSPAAAYLINVFISSASLLTYKPLVDVFNQAVPLATKLVGSRRWSDAAAVFDTFDHSASLLATLVRLAPSLGIATSALPYSVFASTVVHPNGERVQLVDALFDLISQPSLQATSLRLVIRLLKVYLETASRDASRPSLAGMLRHAEKTCELVADVAYNSALNDVKPDAWALLGVIIATQPGCAFFCFGTPNNKKDDKDKDTSIAGPLKLAIDEVLEWETLMRDGPRALAAILGYCQAVIECPSAATSVTALRANGEFWKAINDICVKNVPLPSSFSEHIAIEVQDYSYRVQAKANATALFASELSLVLDMDGPETKAQSLALSMFRNASVLQDAVLAAVHSSCDPELHAGEDASLRDNKVEIVRERTICLPDERDYGVDYLYDGRPLIFNDPERQSAVTRSLAILNLNWSQLDADIAFTKAWRSLAEMVSTWTAGDALAAKATLTAAGAAAAVLAQEDRGGDVMLAIQTERLGILSTLLETALDVEHEVSDTKAIKELAGNVRKIVESSLFSPIISLRHKNLPPIHRPVLRLLLVLSQANNGGAEFEVREVLFDCGTTLALEAADIVLDTIVSEPTAASEQDLALVVALLCEITRVESSSVSSAFLDKLQQVNLISRSLEVIVRTRPVNDVLPAHFHTILLLHLAIASSGPTAERLAVSGVLPAYADNVIAIAAEQARIDTDNESFHRAWCGMLMVVKALLSSLPSVTSFARSDVVPFTRVVMPQLLRAMAWDGETPLSCPTLDELELAVDVFYGLASALGSGSGSGSNSGSGSASAALLDDYAVPAMDLLRGVRFALSHPHRFCGLIVPATEEEQAALEKELQTVEGQKDDVNLVNLVQLPTIAARTKTLLGITRTVLVTLVGVTHAWDMLDGEAPPRPEYVLPFDDDSLSASNDPVGVVNDLFLLVCALLPKLALGDRGPTRQAAEAAALLALTQLLVRRALMPDDELTDDSMEVDSLSASKRRRSSMVKTHRAAQIRSELEGDVRGMLISEAGENKVLEVLQGVAVSRFPE
jgi:nuclear pore complex protein Nup188